MQAKGKGLLAVGAYVVALAGFAEFSNWRAGMYAPELPLAVNSTPDAETLLRMSVPIASLPQQASLYQAVVEEFAKTSRFVCIGSSSGAEPGDTADAKDPPADIVALLTREPAFRPLSNCQHDAQEVTDKVTGSHDGVVVILTGADSAASPTKIGVIWCCWVGWGVFGAELTSEGWALRSREQWLQS